MKQRIITGGALAIAVLLGVLYLPKPAFALLLLLVGSLAYYEWRNMLGLIGRVRLIYWGGTTLLLAAIMAVNHFIYPLTNWLFPLAIVWLAMPVILAQHERSPISWLTHPSILMGMSIVTVIGFVLSITILQAHDRLLLIYIILLVAVADSGAYFVGRKFGRRKLAPSISPGKSWEGVFGGWILSLFFTLIYAAIVGYSLSFTLSLTLLGIIVVPVSVSGDLFESVVKRHRGLKDSGNILPGHGGILDRIDALTAAAPLFLSGLILIEGSQAFL